MAKKSKSSGNQVACAAAYPLLCSRACSYLTIGIKSKDYSGQKLMQMGDYRLDHLVGFDLHGKKVELLEPVK
jgi:D-lactate dehydrogenase